ncbi:MAG: DUF2380 domain-containing protein [Azospirillum sp.]|nr:DUF2380 domain-containing protein [Azospirillum sp.]
MPGAVIAALIWGLMVFPAWAGEPVAAPIKAVVFGVDIHDTSGEPVPYGRSARLAAITRFLAGELASSGRFAIVAPKAEDESIPVQEPDDRCAGCAAARALGGEVYVSALVIKVSTLILSLRLWVQDARTGRSLVEAVADIRGDNDPAWQRGIRWLVRNRVLPAFEVH